MPSFSYKARNPRGEIVEGRVEAITAAKLADQLAASGVIPVSIREEKGKAPATATKKVSTEFTLRGVNIVDVIFFSRQMHTMRRAGVPVFTA
jgi:MSHA biogenesis protein MshG